METLLAEMRTFLEVYNRGLDTGDNSLIRDIVLLPYAIGGKIIGDQIEAARDLHLLSEQTTTDLDWEAGNYNLERLPGSYATVVLTFYAANIPTQDVVIPNNTQARTAGTSFVSPVTFETVAEARFTLADMSSYYSHDRARYEFDVTALCVDIGSAGVVSANLINQMVSSIAGVDGVTNRTASSGGTDGEIDDDLRVRIQTRKTGRDLNTVDGLRGYVRDAGFLDAYPVRVEDADSERAAGIDVFVINQSSAVATETFTYDPSQTRYYLSNRPVLEVTSVVGENAGTLSASDFDSNVDNTTPMRRSIYGMDYVTFRASAALLTGEQITVTYNYSALIRQVQQTLDENENDVLTADPLIKRGLRLYFYINATLTLKANADGALVRNRVRNALSQYLARYRMGNDIQQSDIIIVIQEGYGDYPIEMVDAVVINSYHVQDEDGNTRQPVSSVISVENKEYVVYGQATIT
jgi:hypothetical protein